MGAMGADGCWKMGISGRESNPKHSLGKNLVEEKLFVELLAKILSICITFI